MWIEPRFYAVDRTAPQSGLRGQECYAHLQVFGSFLVGLSEKLGGNPKIILMIISAYKTTIFGRNCGE